MEGKARSCPMKHEAAQLGSNQEFMTAAVKQDGLTLRLAAANVKSDRAVVLAAVREDGHGLQYAEAELQSDRVNQNSDALDWAPAEFQNDHDILVRAMLVRFQYRKYALTFIKSKTKKGTNTYYNASGPCRSPRTMFPSFLRCV